MTGRYRILKYPWHTGHDYELSKIPHDFFYLTDNPRTWATSNRPIPNNITWVPEIGHIETDVMILHLDQWSFHEPSKRHLFLRYRRQYSGPKIVINHGCNLVDGCSSETMRDLVEGCYMVCNSPLARKLWGVPNSRYIRHGMSIDEWPQTNYGNHNILVVQPHSQLHAACRNVGLIQRAESLLTITWVGRDKRFDSFDKYRHFLQSSSIFFQPSFASANPRARTEAMLSGLAVVTTALHGEDEYIENGINGFASNDEDELLFHLQYLYHNPEQVREIGMAGRKTAQDLFHIDQFTQQWNTLLEDLLAQTQLNDGRRQWLAS